MIKRYIIRISENDIDMFKQEFENKYELGLLLKGLYEDTWYLCLNKKQFIKLKERIGSISKNEI